MIEGVSATVTGKLVEVALDALALRQRVHANNIANAGSEGFLPQRVDFESALQQTAASTDRGLQVESRYRLSQFQDQLQRGEYLRMVEATGVELDTEMAALNETVLRYQAIVQGLIQYNSLTAMAVSGDGNK